jgi:pimeloyl-ACP methyl ester carboxylesterase
MAAIDALALSGGRSLCVRRWPGEGVPIVLLHGLLDSSEGWNDVCTDLAHPCFAFDVPGFGRSDAPSRGSLAGYAADVAEGLRALGLERFVLVGHSLGGAIAAALAEILPEQVAALVLLAPAGFGRIHLAEAISIPGVRELTALALPSLLSSRLAVTAGYVTMVSNGMLPERDVVDRVVDRGSMLAAGAREGTRAIVAAGRSRRAFHRRGLDYLGPVYAVWGDRDRLVPSSHADGVRAALPQARVELWPGMAHHFQRERRRELLALIARACAVAAAEPAVAPGTPARHAA